MLSACKIILVLWEIVLAAIRTEEFQVSDGSQLLLHNALTVDRESSTYSRNAQFSEGLRFLI